MTATCKSAIVFIPFSMTIFWSTLDNLGSEKKHSTETALIKIIDDLLFSLDNDKVSGMVLADYRKAFDMVDHELLLKKLEAYGIVNQELRWCRSYLSSRKQAVNLDGAESCESLVKHGVPQGSILGLLFFILFINDLPLHVSSQIDLYADDTTITNSSDFRNISHLEVSLNTSVSEIQLWANANKLPLNEEKTKVLMITGKRLAPKLCNLPNVTTEGAKTLKIVNSATLLGLEIDNMLSFNLHVEMICKRLSSWIAVLRKIIVFLPLSQRLLYYNAIIWSSCDKELLYRVLKLQKRAARVILYTDRQTSSVALFNKLHWVIFYEQS